MNKDRKKRQTEIMKAAMMAAIYVVVCMVLQPISFGPIQFRFSEILCLLSVDHRWALWGAILGCFLSNTFLGGLGIIDIAFGTLATAAGCILAHRFREKRIKGYPILSAMMIVLANAIIIGIELGFIFDTPDLIGLYMIQVGIGEALVLSLGLLFYKQIDRMFR